MSKSSNTTNKSRLNPAICPLCGNPNRCALAADRNTSDCWCETVEFPRELLAQIPRNADRRACICQNCLEKYRESIDVPQVSP